MSFSNDYHKCLQEIARLNNEGAHYLASNMSGDAVRALKSSLVIMGTIADKDEMMDCCNGDNNKSNSCPSLDVPGLDDSFFIFNRALLLDTSPFVVDLSATNAVILFNLALAFHQKGLVCGHGSKLGKALHLYELCTRLISDVTSSSGLLVLAALNNQAQIYYSLCSYAKVGEILSTIRSVAEYVPVPEVSPNDDTPAPAFEQRHLEEIYLNVAITQPPTTAASA